MLLCKLSHCALNVALTLSCFSVKKFLIFMLHLLPSKNFSRPKSKSLGLEMKANLSFQDQYFCSQEINMNNEVSTPNSGPQFFDDFR